MAFDEIKHTGMSATVAASTTCYIFGYLSSKGQNLQKLHWLLSIQIRTKQRIGTIFGPKVSIFLPVQFITCQLREVFGKKKPDPLIHCIGKKQMIPLDAIIFCDTSDIIWLFLATATVPVVMLTFSQSECRCNRF